MEALGAMKHCKDIMMLTVYNAATGLHADPQKDQVLSEGH